MWFDLDEYMGGEHETLRFPGIRQQCSFGPSLLDLRQEPDELLAVNDRTDCGSRVLRIAQPQITDALDEASGELVVDRILDNDAVDSHADLPLVQELAHHTRMHCLL
ncbi:hypothetical protein D9M70_505570 [compost metagenome]